MRTRERRKRSLDKTEFISASKIKTFLRYLFHSYTQTDKVSYLVMHPGFGWRMDLSVPLSFSVAQLLLSNFHLPRQNRIDRATLQFPFNQTQVHDRMRQEMMKINSQSSLKSTQCPNYMRKLPLDRMLKTKRPSSRATNTHAILHAESAPLEALRVRRVAPTSKTPKIEWSTSNTVLTKQPTETENKDGGSEKSLPAVA